MQISVQNPRIFTAAAVSKVFQICDLEEINGGFFDVSATEFENRM